MAAISGPTPDRLLEPKSGTKLADKIAGAIGGYETLEVFT
jgi:hypothetical protein